MRGMPNLKPIPAANTLLAALPDRDFKRLRAAMGSVTMTFGEVLCEAGQRIRHVYFPTDSLVSLLTLVDAHLPLEVGLIGREGMVGVALALGATTSPVRALVQGSGSALRMEASRFRREFENCKPLQVILLRYAHVLMVQVSQTAACNRFHVIEARLARWLLMTRDRMRSRQFRLTQEFLAHMLGVRRVGVTNAAQTLKRRKLIDYNRGNIFIINETGLESACCSCYESIKGVSRQIF